MRLFSHKLIPAFALLLLCSSGCALFGPQKSKEDAFLDKAKLAVDPDGFLDKVNTTVTLATMTIPQQKITGKVKTQFKMPNKMRTDSNIANMIKETTVFDGESGWTISSMTGKRELKGAELGCLKLQALLESPRDNLQQISKKVQLFNPGEEGGDPKLYKLVCTPKEDFQTKPFSMYFDPDTYLLKRVELTLTNALGEIPTTTRVLEFRKIDGVLLPTKTENSCMGMKMVITVDSVKRNVDIPDSTFKQP